MRRISLALLALVSLACPSGPDPQPTPGQDTAKPPTGAEAGESGETGEAAGPTPDKPISAELPANALPGLDLKVVVAECAPLPKLSERLPESQAKLVPALAALRELSCHPELWAEPKSVILEKIEAPKDLDLDVGRRFASVELGESALVQDILKVAGVTDAKMQLVQGWSSHWIVVSGDPAEPPRPWGAAQLTLRPGGERNDDREHGTIGEIEADTSVDQITIVMTPEDMGFQDDPDAASAVAAALDAMAKDANVLAMAPKDAHAALPHLGERYSLHHYAEGLGEEQRKGFSINPKRTELGAAPFAEALGLPDARHERIHITDTNPNRLQSAGETEIVWRGLQLEIELEKTRKGLGLAQWSVDSILVLPAPEP